MFSRKPEVIETDLDKALTEAYHQLNDEHPASEAYAKTAAQIIMLENLRNNIKPVSQRLSPDTVAVVCANLAGIVMILEYEHARVVTSKALSFVMKAAR